MMMKSSSFFGGKDQLLKDLVTSGVGNFLYDTAKGIFSYIFSNPDGLLNISKYDNLLDYMSPGSKNLLESLLKTAQELVELIQEAEKNNDKELAAYYRQRLSTAYEQMSTLMSYEAYHIEQKSSKMGAFARELSTALLEVSREIINPGFPLPKFSRGNLRASQNGSEQNSTVASFATSAAHSHQLNEDDGKKTPQGKNLPNVTGSKIFDGLNVLKQIKLSMNQPETDLVNASVESTKQKNLVSQAER
jgi:hypothetical protein